MMARACRKLRMPLQKTMHHWRYLTAQPVRRAKWQKMADHLLCRMVRICRMVSVAPAWGQMM